MSGTFGLIDYAIFALTLIISVGIGIYFAFRRRTSQNAGEFLVGGRKMPVIPTSLSLLTSFVSGISILAYPGEMYMNGTAFAWTGFGAILSMLFSGFCLIPVLYSVESWSVYRYFQDRFDSAVVRLMASSMFCVSTLFYLAVVLYAPSTALASVTGLPLWLLLVTVGLACTIYTTIGGLRAVIWTDTFQSMVMFGGCIVLAVKGTTEAGGWSTVWAINYNRSRLDGFVNFDPNPFQKMTFWTATFGGMFFWLGAFGANQMALQRYCSLPSLNKAKVVVLLNIPAIFVILGLVFYTGLVMFAFYADCDPKTAGYVKTTDQLVIWFMLEILGHIPGLPGLFIACLFSGTLSTVSSGINSLAAVSMEDYVRPILTKSSCVPLQQQHGANITKIISCFYGLLTVALAFLAEPLGGILSAVFTTLGCFSGPLVGLIILGILVPFANKYGAIVGAVVALGVNLWIAIGNIVYKPVYTGLSLSIANCTLKNGSLMGFANATLMNSVGNRNNTVEGIQKLYSTPTILYTLIGAAAVVLVGIVLSLCTGGLKSKAKRELLLWSY